MAKSTKSALEKEIKDKYTTMLIDFLKSQDEDVGRVKDNKFNFPIVDADGNENFVVVTVTIPRGARIDKSEGGGYEPYDGYGDRESYEIDLRTKQEKATVNAEKKAAKIKRDEEYRAKKAEQKRRHEEKGE